MMAQPTVAEVLFGADDKTALGAGTKLISLHPKHDGQKNIPVVTPIYHSSTYYAANCMDFTDQVKDGYIYNRIRTPNSEELEMIMSELEGGEGSVAFPSGMSALSSTFLCFLSPGDHIVASSPLYSCIQFLFSKYFPQYNIEVSFVEAGSDIDNYRKACRANTKLLYGETICNPMMWLLDIKGLANIGQELGVMTMVDATFSSPINQRPLKHGIDIVVHSCTKYMGGHSDLLAGCSTFANSRDFTKLKTWQSYFGPTLSAFDSVLLTRSLRTLQVRMQRHNENGLKVAQFLQSHPKVKAVHYLGLPSHPQYNLAEEMLDGFGGMMSIEFGTQQAAIKFAESTKIFKCAVSLGGAESLIEHVRTMTHGDWVMSQKDRDFHGITDDLVRLSVGIEDVADQIRDLTQALAGI